MMRYGFNVGKSLQHPMCNNPELLSDAETGEDGCEDFRGGDGAGDGGEMVEGFAEVLGYEVGGYA